jgi:hypothetical protein
MDIYLILDKLLYSKSATLLGFIRVLQILYILTFIKVIIDNINEINTSHNFDIVC